VLNAFRHHRGGHIVTAPTQRTLGSVSAQRLSASQRWAYRASPSTMTSLSGAQRLSASQRWASPRPFPEATGRRVLNAFRHHRGGHSRRPGLRLVVGDVLNAFRHHRGGHPHRSCGRLSNPRAQRLSASQRWAYCGGQWRLLNCGCSTPFGITEVSIRMGGDCCCV